MTEAKFQALLAKQMPDAEKRARADFVVDSGRGFEAAREQVREILKRAWLQCRSDSAESPPRHEGTMREIVLDTETTGLDPNQGHRLVEVGCVELLNRIPTGATFHAYLNPERDMPAEAFAIHGLSSEFLKDKPLFADVADDFLAFIGDDPLVIHNASFDHGFLCAELKRVERALIARERLVDTLTLARRKHSAGPYNLDALCSRYGHRQFAPHQARRAARCRNPRRGLSRADRRPPGDARPCRARQRSEQQGRWCCGGAPAPEPR